MSIKTALWFWDEITQPRCLYQREWRNGINVAWYAMEGWSITVRKDAARPMQGD